MLPLYKKDFFIRKLKSSEKDIHLSQRQIFKCYSRSNYKVETWD